MEVISRKEAREAGLTRYFTGKPCKRGHVVARRTVNATCMVCHKQAIKTLQVIGGSQHCRRKERTRRARSPGGSRRRNHLSDIARWRKSGRPAAVNYRLAMALRRRLLDALRPGCKVGSAVRDLGCSVAFLREYLAARFQPGMTWDNHSVDGWHVDHRRPLASFDLGDRLQFLEAVHYTNLQPLWAADNLAKGASYAQA